MAKKKHARLRKSLRTRAKVARAKVARAKVVRAKVVCFESFNKTANGVKFCYLVDNKTRVYEYFVLAQRLRVLSNEMHNKFPREWNNFAFHLGMARFCYFYARLHPKSIDIKAAHLDQASLDIWKRWYFMGTAEFLYRNKMTLKPTKITNSDARSNIKAFTETTRPESLVFCGGGKDSSVAGEIMKHLDQPFEWVIVHGGRNRRKMIQLSGNSKTQVCWFRYGPKGMNACKAKFKFNYGHMPLNLVLSFIGCFLAFINQKQFIVLANEKSANIANLKTHGISVNHQYSKSFEFEQKVHHYIHKNLSPNIDYFSILRGMLEGQIARVFAKFPKYHWSFISCNKTQHLGRWCKSCDKCAFIFMAMYPFVKTQKISKIIGSNLFKKKRMLKNFKNLCGFGSHKPFECVGTIEENKELAKLCLEKNNPEKPFVLRKLEPLLALDKNNQSGEKMLSKYDANPKHNLIPKDWDVNKLIEKWLHSEK